MRVHYDVIIGRYSYGECLRPGKLPRGTIVGNFCSLAAGIRVFRRNHPLKFIYMHPVFYNSMLDLIEQDTIKSVKDNPLTIMHDSWIGERVIITPSCRRIGIGSVVGAGAVVTRDVPEFTVVAGNPAREIKKRFSDEIEAVIMGSRWWEYSIEELLPVLPIFLREASLENALRLCEHLKEISPE